MKLYITDEDGDEAYIEVNFWSFFKFFFFSMILYFAILFFIGFFFGVMMAI